MTERFWVPLTLTKLSGACNLDNLIEHGGTDLVWLHCIAHKILSDYRFSFITDILN